MQNQRKNEYQNPLQRSGSNVLKKLSRVGMELVELEKMANNRKFDFEKEITHLINSLKDYGDTNYERSLLQQVELMKREIEQLKKIEFENRERIFKLSNLYRIKAKFIEIRKFDDPRVVTETSKLKKEIEVTRSAIKLRRIDLERKLYELKENPIIKSFSRMNRVVNPETGHYVFLNSRGDNSDKFRSKDQIYEEKRMDMFTKPPTRVRKFESNYAKEKDFDELDEEVYQNLGRNAVMGHIVANDDYERLHFGKYQNRVNDTPQLYYSHYNRSKLYGSVKSDWQLEEEKKIRRERLFLSEEQKIKLEEERRLKDETLYITNGARSADIGPRDDSHMKEDGDNGGGGLNGSRLYDEVVKPPSRKEVEDRPRGNYYRNDRRSLRAKKPRTESSLSHFKPDNSISEINASNFDPKRGSETVKRLRFADKNETYVFERDVKSFDNS